MERTEVLRSSDLEQLDYIQQKIEVVCHNNRQLPVGFAFSWLINNDQTESWLFY
jgi:hypothetical protein